MKITVFLYKRANSASIAYKLQELCSVMKQVTDLQVLYYYWSYIVQMLNKINNLPKYPVQVGQHERLYC